MRPQRSIAVGHRRGERRLLGDVGLRRRRSRRLRFATSAAVSSAEARSRSTASTLAPSCAKRSTVARPLPMPSPGLCPAPTTTAILPARRIKRVQISSAQQQGLSRMTGSVFSQVRRDPTGDLVRNPGGQLPERGQLFGGPGLGEPAFNSPQSRRGQFESFRRARSGAAIGSDRPRPRCPAPPRCRSAGVDKRDAVSASSRTLVSSSASLIGRPGVRGRAGYAR